MTWVLPEDNVPQAPDDVPCTCDMAAYCAMYVSTIIYIIRIHYSHSNLILVRTLMWKSKDYTNKSNVPVVIPKGKFTATVVSGERALIADEDFNAEELLPLSFFGKLQLKEEVTAIYQGSNNMPEFPGTTLTTIFCLDRHSCNYTNNAPK